MKIQFADQENLHEIYGKNTSLQYSFLNKKLYGIHPPVQCKDYLQDIVWSEIMNEPIEIYGLNYKPTGTFLNDTIFRMGLSHPKQDIKKYLESTKWVLSQLTNRLFSSIDRIEPLVELDETEKALLIKADIRLLSVPWILSLLTALIRNCSDINVKNYESIILYLCRKQLDKDFITALTLIEKGILFEQSYEDYKQVNGDFGLHDYGGVKSFKPKKIAKDNKELLNSIYKYNKTTKELVV